MSNELTEYVVVSPSYRKFRRELINGRLAVVGTKRYKRGDLVPLDEEEAERLLGLGAVRPVDSDEGQPVDDEDTGPVDPEATGDPSGSPADDDDPGDDEDDEPVDYESMEYSALQDLAKERDLPYNSVSKVNIIASLQEYDANHAD